MSRLSERRIRDFGIYAHKKKVSFLLASSNFKPDYFHFYNGETKFVLKIDTYTFGVYAPYFLKKGNSQSTELTQRLIAYGRYIKELQEKMSIIIIYSRTKQNFLTMSIYLLGY